jgi:hypothetical protein
MQPIITSRLPSALSNLRVCLLNFFELEAFFIAILFFPCVVRCQEKNGVEFSFFSTYNKQGEYETRYGDVAFTNHLTLYGPDIGFKIDYKRILYGKTFFKIGLGYMNFGVSKIENETNGMPNPGRLINYPSTIFIQYETTKYHYNNLIFHLGLEKQFPISQDLSFFAAADYFHADKLSQKYYIPGADAYYHTSTNGNLGDFFNINIGISKKISSISFLPALVIPIYKSWRKDVVFKEDPGMSISNWAGGIGIMLSVSYH